MKFYDPYKIKDPTEPHNGLPSQGRTGSGKFTHRSILSTMTDENFPIDSNHWKSLTGGTVIKVTQLRGSKFADKVLPRKFITGKGKNRFSYRMITEMFEVARDSILAGESDEQAIQSAHAWLESKQAELQTVNASPLVDRQNTILHILKDEAVHLNASQREEYFSELGEIETALQKGGAE